MIAGAAMGVGAMVAGALKMPMTAVLLPSLLFLSDAVHLMPVVIVAVVVSYVVAVWIAPPPAPVETALPAPDGATVGVSGVVALPDEARESRAHPPGHVCGRNDGRCW